MTFHRWLVPALGLVPLLVSIAIPSTAIGNTAGYSFISSPAPSGPGYARITAEAQNGFTFDYDWGYLEKYSDDAAAEEIRAELAAQGWFVTRTGSTIDIIGHSGPPFRPIRKIDADDGTDSLRVLLFTDAVKDESLPPDKNFTFSCALPAAHGVTPGSIVTRINSFTATAALSPNDTPAQAAARVRSALAAAGFVATLSGSTVTVDWDDPTNAALIGPAAHVEYELIAGASGPHLILGLPGTAPPVPATGPWTVFVAFTILSAAGYLGLRCRRPATA